MSLDIVEQNSIGVKGMRLRDIPTTISSKLWSSFVDCKPFKRSEYKLNIQSEINRWWLHTWGLQSWWCCVRLDSQEGLLDRFQNQPNLQYEHWSHSQSNTSCDRKTESYSRGPVQRVSTEHPLLVMELKEELMIFYFLSPCVGKPTPKLKQRFVLILFSRQDRDINIFVSV